MPQWNRDRSTGAFFPDACCDAADGPGGPGPSHLHSRRNPVRARAGLFLLVAMSMLTHEAHSQARTSTSSVVGTWQGTSICLAHPSPCHDELVVYHITRAGTRDSLTIDARKMVHGVEEDMGVLGCRIDAAKSRLDCRVPNGKWTFTVRGDSMIGEIRL